MRPHAGQFAIVVGLAVFVLLLVLPAPGAMSADAWRTAAVAVLMVTWWVTEAIPVPATALLPAVLLPVLGIVSMEEAAAPYASPVVGLFFGGFLIAQAMQRANLHRRIALYLIASVGTRPDAMIGGFMVAAAFLSMWISNTATAVMMLPIGISVANLVASSATDATDGAGAGDFPVALMLGIAYACSIGGLGTLIGSPPNALLASFMASQFEVSIGFVEWMGIGMPLVIVGLPLAWLILTRGLFQVSRTPVAGAAGRLGAELSAMGSLSRAERVVGTVFAITALAWVLRPLLGRVTSGLSDTGIALAAAVILFMLPVGQPDGRRALDWESARMIPWDVLVLFGGGLSLAGAMSSSGLADWLGSALGGLEGLPIGVTLVLVTAAVIFITELMSNTAAAATFLPVLAALAVDIGQPPLAILVPAALASSCAFMMPVATPPNAIVFASGQVSMRQMARAGVVMNLVFVALVSAAGMRFLR